MERLEDRDLVQLAVSGETWAFGRLAERYGGRIFGRIRRLVRQPDDAEDLVQEVFLLAFRRLGQLHDGSRFSPWLSRIAENTAREWHRRRMVQIRFEELLSKEWSRPHADESQAEREARMMVREAIRRLSGAHREVIEYHYFKGRSYGETAYQLGLEVNTVRSRLQKARQRIKKEMSEMTIAGNTYDLTAQDIQALYWATRFVSTDESRRILQGVCLDTGGRVVGCDGARLLLRTLEGTEDLEKQVILGPGFELPEPQHERATLSIRGKQAFLKAGGEDELVIPVLDVPYVNYEAVIPAKGGSFVRISAGELLQAVSLITEHLEPRHPAAGVWTYSPQVEVQISSEHQTLSLVTSRDLGYRAAKENAGKPVSNDDAPWAGVPYWRFTTSINGKVNLKDSPEPFRSSVNHSYLSDAVSGIESGGMQDIHFTDPMEGLLFTSCDYPDRKALVMPMRIE
ncbi:MAG: sigma-70 family RNA polymerase sigma factor [Gemmatimonadota bacterium]|nr:sigma-70 family RNA polymerase sigma factor [Gemmatimonadota bacterium]